MNVFFGVTEAGSWQGELDVIDEPEETYYEENDDSAAGPPASSSSQEVYGTSGEDRVQELVQDLENFAAFLLETDIGPLDATALEAVGEEAQEILLARRNESKGKRKELNTAPAPLPE